MSIDSSSNRATSESCWTVVSGWILGANLTWSALLSAGIFQSSPRLVHILEAFDTPLSGLTILALSQFFRYLVPVLALLALGKEWIFRSARMNVWINIAHTFLILTVQAIYVAGIFGPIFELLDRLS